MLSPAPTPSTALAFAFAFWSGLAGCTQPSEAPAGRAAAGLPDLRMPAAAVNPDLALPAPASPALAEVAGDLPTPNHFIGAQACGECHKKQLQRWQKDWHARAL